MGELLAKNTAVAPATVDQHGALGDRVIHFLTGSYDNPPAPLDIDPATCPNATAMDAVLCSNDIPVGILHQATMQWRAKNATLPRPKLYG